MIERTDAEFRSLLQRIKETWRWHYHYTGVFVDGTEYKTPNPNIIPSEGLLGVYDGTVDLEQLKNDLTGDSGLMISLDTLTNGRSPSA